MQEQFQVLSLFPIALYIGLIEGGILPEELEFARSLDYDPNSGGNLSSADHYVLDHPRMARLRAIADRHLEVYRKEILATDNEVPVARISLR